MEELFKDIYAEEDDFRGLQGQSFGTFSEAGELGGVRAVLDSMLNLGRIGI